MRRGTILLVAFALVGSLVFPGVAMADRGGNGNGNGHAKDDTRVPPGQARKVEPVAEDAVDAALDPHEVAKAERETAREEFRIAQELRRTEREQARETSATGMANAVDRIGANLERMAVKIADGKRKQLPPGLVQVWLKFMTTLGEEVTIDDVPGSDIASGTVLPGDGMSDDDTDTPEPEEIEEEEVDPDDVEEPEAPEVEDE